MSIKTILGWAAVAFVAWWAISHQAGAAHIVGGIGHFLASVVRGISSFFAKI